MCHPKLFSRHKLRNDLYNKYINSRSRCGKGNQRESYDEEFKRKTVEHMETENKRPTEIARELNILKSTLSRWIKQYGSDAVESQTQVFVDYERLKKLEQLNLELLEENEILKKAKHFFTKDPR
ncbi:transposase [Paenibacillus phytorum]|uniref:transposase n=1 Tax=Paenibacillus phytorum TaxID=2654977 RepID=UPI001492BEEF|nr:transposase [Paenibacillus phytorum]